MNRIDTAVLYSLVRDVPDFPLPGVTFKDLNPILADADARHLLINDLWSEVSMTYRPSCIVGIDARGFVFASPLAEFLEIPLVLVRKQGKLPPPCQMVEYKSEYATAFLTIQRDLLAHCHQRVVVVDDVLATGGTALAACNLVEQVGGTVAGVVFAYEIPHLGGRELLKGYSIYSALGDPY